MAIDTLSWAGPRAAGRCHASGSVRWWLYKGVSAGINTAVELWAQSCNGSKADMLALRQFMKAHVLASFRRTNPWGEKHLYQVNPDSINPKFINGNLAEIAFTFEQAFAP